MQKYIVLIFIFGLQFSHSNAQNNYVEARDCELTLADLEVEFNRGSGMSTYSLDGLPFTGCAKEDIQENEMYYLHYVKNGKLERQIGYYYSGQKCRDFNYKNGVAHGLLELFYSDGSHYIREEYLDGKLHGSLKRWKNGQLVRDAKFWYGTMVSEQLFEVVGTKEMTEEEKKLGGNC